MIANDHNLLRDLCNVLTPPEKLTTNYMQGQSILALSYVLPYKAALNNMHSKRNTSLDIALKKFVKNRPTQFESRPVFRLFDRTSEKTRIKVNGLSIVFTQI